MGEHQGQGGRRGIAAWVWAVPLTVVIIAALVVGWVFLVRGSKDDGGDANGCLAGDLTLLVWADPAAAQTAEHLVDNYNASSPVVRDHCVRALTEVKPTAEVVEAYRGGAPGVAPVWFPLTAGDAAGLPGAPAEVPVVPGDGDGGSTDGAGDLPVVAFGSSPAVDEDTARAAADFVREASAAGADS